VTELAYCIGVDFGTGIRACAPYSMHRSRCEILAWSDVRLLGALKRIRIGKEEGP
jgi:hypothetical protein